MSNNGLKFGREVLQYAVGFGLMLTAIHYDCFALGFLIGLIMFLSLGSNE